MADTEPATAARLRERIDWMVDEDPLKLRDALYAVLDRLDAESEGAARQMAAGDYRLCPPDMLRIYCHDAICGVLGATHLIPDDCPDCTPTEPCCSMHDECNDEGIAHAD